MENNYFIRLYISLKHSEEEMINKIWMQNSQDKIYHRKNAIKEYCEKENCDFMIALYSIVENHKTNTSLNPNDISDLEKQILKIAKQRHRNPLPYINNPLNLPIQKENYYNLSTIQKQFYYPHTPKTLPPQPTTTNTPISPTLTLNHTLNKPQVRKIFKALCKTGCLEPHSQESFLAFMNHPKGKTTHHNPIEWKKTKALCAYFVDSFSHRVLKSERIIWKPFETLFSQKNLVRAKNDYQKTGILPKGAKEINKIWDEVLKKSN
ncbi:MAG: hypothetical protein RBT05_03080 [Bacteroidales bacterium]|jgi:hypothetical protein|nr:hypothetical protein [Bacteroidales bacterium]